MNIESEKKLKNMLLILKEMQDKEQRNTQICSILAYLDGYITADLENNNKKDCCLCNVNSYDWRCKCDCHKKENNSIN